MLHAVLMILGLTSCNPYEGDVGCRANTHGGYISQIVMQEGYGLPIPVLVSDFLGDKVTQDRVQAALDIGDGVYVLVQTKELILLSSPIVFEGRDKILQDGWFSASDVLVKPAFDFR